MSPMGYQTPHGVIEFRNPRGLLQYVPLSFPPCVRHGIDSTFVGAKSDSTILSHRGFGVESQLKADGGKNILPGRSLIFRVTTQGGEHPSGELSSLTFSQHLLEWYQEEKWTIRDSQEIKYRDGVRKRQHHATTSGGGEEAQSVTHTAPATFVVTDGFIHLRPRWTMVWTSC